MDGLGLYPNRKYCSPVCSKAAHLQQMIPRRRTSGKARKFRGTLCASCGSTERLEIHHKDQNHQNNAEHNLTTLCVPCHDAEHRVHGMVNLRKGLTCSVCPQPYYSLGYCHKHYKRYRKYGDPQTVYASGRREGSLTGVPRDSAGRLIFTTPSEAA